MAMAFGPESMLGMAGQGMVSPESLRNQRIADDLCARRRPKEAVPYIEKAMKDKNNVDIFVTAAFLAPSYKDCIETLDEGKRRGRAYLQRKFGPKALDNDGPLAEEFYSKIETRPYMRLLQAYVRLHVEFKKYARAVDAIIEMFCLNRNDPMRQNTWLGALLCHTKRYADALYFAQVFMDVATGRLAVEDLPPGGGTKFLAPRQDMYTLEEQPKLKYYEATIMYTAALASFKLWGDSEQARMYLRLAAVANPKVLVKVLGRVRKPESLNTAPRSFNSPEDAHDYLWLSQDLWMEDDVWAWASENPDTKKMVLLECGREGCWNEEDSPTQFQRCSGCRQISYCSRECQKSDWVRHKQDCTRLQSLKSIGRALSSGKPLPADIDMPVFAGDFLSTGIYTQEVPKSSKAQKNKKKRMRKKAKAKAAAIEVGDRGGNNEDDDGDGDGEDGASAGEDGGGAENGRSKDSGGTKASDT